MTRDTQFTRQKYQRVARFYDLLDLPFVLRRYAALRKVCFEGTRGGRGKEEIERLCPQGCV